MGVDRRDNSVTQIADVRRRIVFRAFGALRFLMRVQAILEDVEGAIEHGQYDVAAFQARCVVLVCLSIRSLESRGDIDFDDALSVSFDFFAGLAPDEIAAGAALANEAVDLDERTSAEWLDRLRSYVAEVERSLDFGGRLPVLRSPEGAFGLIGLVRRWSPVLEELGLPGLLPSKWLPHAAVKSGP